MKKLLSVFLVLSMLFVFASCEHKCEFSADWISDGASHWHACTDEVCELISDKADHTWNEGEITTVATQEADGVKTFRCTVCEKTKTESVPFAGMTSAEWDAAFADSRFENFMYEEDGVVKGSGVSVETEEIYKFTKTGAWRKVTLAGTSEESYAPDLGSANEARSSLVASLRELASFAKYSYDAASKTYKANTPIRFDELDASTTDVTLTFDRGVLVKIEYRLSFVQENIQMEAHSVITLSQYGSVTFAE